MSLLAYSLRRAFGSALVLLAVIWLIQFAVSHFDAPDAASSGLRTGVLAFLLSR
jgi:hypothetical protein